MRPSFAAIRRESQVLPPGTLARFAPGLDWKTIAALDTTKGRAWWRCAVADAEERGLLEWTAPTWRLSAAGREHVRDVV